MNVDRIDHLVLTVRDIKASISFYTRGFGMQAVTYDDNRYALHFGDHKINLHQGGKEFEPKADRPTPGSADLCFVTNVPMKQVLEHLAACHVTIVEGSV